LTDSPSPRKIQSPWNKIQKLDVVHIMQR
jgi:hypothetical protein